MYCLLWGNKLQAVAVIVVWCTVCLVSAQLTCQSQLRSFAQISLGISGAYYV